jgi:alkylhydroperoxidase family enzyme
MRHPRLAGPFLAYNNVLLFAPTLEPRTRELLILRVAARTRADYEWAQHVRMAARAGVTPNEITAVRDGTDPSGWSPLETALLAAADELVDDHRVGDDTWARLAEHFDDKQLIELVFVVGTYTALAMAFNSFGLELDPDLRADAGIEE